MKAELKQVIGLLKAQKGERPMILLTDKNTTVKGMGIDVLKLLSNLFLALRKAGIDKETLQDILDLSYESLDKLLEKLKDLENECGE